METDRLIREEQDRAFQESLLADQEKVPPPLFLGSFIAYKRCAVCLLFTQEEKAREEERQKEEEERRIHEEQRRLREEEERKAIHRKNELKRKRSRLPPEPREGKKAFFSLAIPGHASHLAMVARGNGMHRRRPSSQWIADQPQVPPFQYLQGTPGDLGGSSLSLPHSLCICHPRRTGYLRFHRRVGARGLGNRILSHCTTSPPHAPRAVLIFLSLQATFSRSSFTEDAGPIGEADLGERILFFIAKN